MADVQWYTVVIPLVGGGAMGALINLQLFIVTAPEKERPGEIELSSTEAIRFVATPTITEAIAEAARYVTFIELGPVRVSFLR
jgi:hypothetical protein